MGKELIQKIEAKIAAHQPLQLQNDKYIIRAFTSYGEIVDEGIALKNAIAEYAKQRYSKGDDYLFLFRKADSPDVPYGALEFTRNGICRIAQREMCYLLKDPDELAFIEQFQNEILTPYISEGKK